MSAPEEAPVAPCGLGPAGGALWSEITSSLRLRADELAVLAQAARVVDVIERLEAAAAADEVVVAGSKGQPAVHPAVAEARLQRLALGRLLGTLDIPDTDERAELAAARRARRARAAATARWAG